MSADTECMKDTQCRSDGMESYTTIKQYARSEYEEKKSVFIGEALPVQTEAEALAFIESVRKRFSDARHHVFAYVLRDNSIMRFSDDHEPQGTAGMPVLDVIRKNGCTDTVIVVTRYFGGTLLGTGGLVRAYTAAALGALNGAEIIRYDIYTELSVTVSYSDYGKIGSALSDNGFRCEDTDYAADVTVVGKLPKSNLEKLLCELVEITSNRAKTEILGEKFDF